MAGTRKQKLKKKESKNARTDASKAEVLDRIVKLVGLGEVFDDLGPTIRNVLLSQIHSRVEIVVAEDSRDEPEIRYMLRDLRAQLKYRYKSTYRGRPFEISFDDYLQGYSNVVEGLKSFTVAARNERRKSPGMLRLLANLEKANVIVNQIDRNWINRLMAMMLEQIYVLIQRDFRLDDAIISAKMTDDFNDQGRFLIQFTLRLHNAAPCTLKSRGQAWKSYPCRQTGPDGLYHVKWNCPALGIEGPRVELPVYVDQHTIDRLHERLPMTHDLPLLHRMTAEALETPVFFPGRNGRHLVEAKVGTRRLGYFVAEVYPGFVRVVTFLFLTMQGTPESAKLREKMGLFRSDIEGYDLDNFVTMVTSNIKDDPVMSRILTECGCGHLISLCRSDTREFDWLGAFGDRMKQSLEIQEADRGFKVGRKWIKWSGEHPFPKDVAPIKPDSDGDGGPE